METKAITTTKGAALASSAKTPQIITARTIGYRPNPPRNWHEQADGALVCPHRDLSVCPECEKANPEAMDARGMHIWIPLDQRAEMNAMLAAEGIAP